MIKEDRGPVSASLTRAYVRLLGNELLPSWSGGLPASSYPLRNRASVTLTRQRIEAYRQVCGLKADSTLPSLYPQVAAMPLHIQLLSTPGLPGRSLGVVHVGQRVWWHQAMPADVQEMHLETALYPGRPHARGRIFHMDTLWRDPAGQLIWQGESLFLFRGIESDPDSGELSRIPPSPETIPEQSQSLALSCPAGIGRSYAKVSGDWNPIHLSSMSARLFGFQCPIVHGMWALARALGEVESLRENHLSGYALEAWFNAPLFWPSETRLHVSPTADWFQVDRSGKRSRPALWGKLDPIQDASKSKEPSS